MFRTRGAAVLVVAAALIAGGCGGTDWNASGKPKQPAAPQPRVATAAELKAEVPYINAVSTKYPSTDIPGTPADYRCFATAVVHGFGTQGFTARGVTANGLRDPHTTLKDLPEPTIDQVNAIGAAAQMCRLSDLADAMAQSFADRTGAAVACLSRAFARPDARRFLALTILDRPINLGTAQIIVGLISACIDLAAFVVRVTGLPTDASIRQCLTTALHSADGPLKELLALTLSQGDPNQIQQAQDSLGIAINQCRPGAQTGFTVPPS